MCGVSKRRCRKSIKAAALLLCLLVTSLAGGCGKNETVAPTETPPPAAEPSETPQTEQKNLYETFLEKTQGHDLSITLMDMFGEQRSFTTVMSAIRENWAKLPEAEKLSPTSVAAVPYVDWRIVIEDREQDATLTLYDSSYVIRVTVGDEVGYFLDESGSCDDERSDKFYYCGSARYLWEGLTLAEAPPVFFDIKTDSEDHEEIVREYLSVYAQGFEEVTFANALHITDFNILNVNVLEESSDGNAFIVSIYVQLWPSGDMDYFDSIMLLQNNGYTVDNEDGKYHVIKRVLFFERSEDGWRARADQMYWYFEKYSAEFNYFETHNE